MEDGRYYLQPALKSQRQTVTVPVMKVEARTGRAVPFYDAAKMEAAFARLPGFAGEEARKVSRAPLHLNRARTATLVTHADDLFYYELDGDFAVRLTTGPEPEVGEEFSPDGRFVSFVRDHNLHLVEVATQRERALTRDGGPELFYGRLDWVYQEELYGRGDFKGYWWSPDSQRIAFLKLDESPVHEFTIVDHLPSRLKTEVKNYPKAGDPNPLVELGVAGAVGGPVAWVDTSRYRPSEHLIVRVGWTPDGRQIVFQLQDREQIWLDLNLADATTGAMKTLLRETTPAFVEITDQPYWLDDGTLLWQSERTGYRHIYHYKGDGSLIRQVTEGDWEVRKLHGVDRRHNWIYFTATEHRPIEEHVYRVRLDGTGLERLSQRPGSHAAQFSPDFRHYLDTWSDVQTPKKVFLHTADGGQVRVVDDNPVSALGEYRLGGVEFLQIPTRDGFLMEAMLIKPPDFDPGRKYPVLQYNYGGPHAPVVRNAWLGDRFLWHHLLAQRGYVIWMCDNRSASGKGMKPVWETYGRLGEVELRDMEDGLAWLKRQSWVEEDRIGLWGWSYGGFMAAYAMTHSTSYKLAIAGAPVTDWRLYDSIYTERYMRRPQNNTAGYDATSVLKAAANLHGKLLLLHGTTDDNVHFQNTVKLVYALQQAGKEFELMIYADSRHRVRDRAELLHLRRVMTRFILENL